MNTEHISQDPGTQTRTRGDRLRWALLIMAAFMMIVGGGLSWYWSERSQHQRDRATADFLPAGPSSEEKTIQRLVEEKLEQFRLEQLAPIHKAMLENVKTLDELAGRFSDLETGWDALDQRLDTLEIAGNPESEEFKRVLGQAINSILRDVLRDIRGTLETYRQELGAIEVRLRVLQSSAGERDQPQATPEPKPAFAPRPAPPDLTVARIERWGRNVTAVFERGGGQEVTVKLGGLIDGWEVYGFPGDGKVLVRKGDESKVLTAREIAR